MPDFKNYRENPVLLGLIYAAGYVLGEDGSGPYVETRTGARGPAIDAAVQDIIDTFDVNLLPNSLAATLAAKVAEIDAYAGAVRQRVRQAAQPFATAEEMASWPIKAAQARAYVSTQDTGEAPIILAEAAARGVSVDDIAARIIANADALEAAEAAIAGNAGRHKDIVRSIAAQETVGPADVQTIAAYTFADGWPG